MCPKCSGYLVPMEHPDEMVGVKCRNCGRTYYYASPLDYKANMKDRKETVRKNKYQVYRANRRMNN